MQDRVRNNSSRGRSVTTLKDRTDVARAVDEAKFREAKVRGIRPDPTRLPIGVINLILGDNDPIKRIMDPSFITL
jgi:hypothetical protein